MNSPARVEVILHSCRSVLQAWGVQVEHVESNQIEGLSEAGLVRWTISVSADDDGHVAVHIKCVRDEPLPFPLDHDEYRVSRTMTGPFPCPDSEVGPYVLGGRAHDRRGYLTRAAHHLGPTIESHGFHSPQGFWEGHYPIVELHYRRGRETLRVCYYVFEGHAWIHHDGPAGKLTPVTGSKGSDGPKPSPDWRDQDAMYKYMAESLDGYLAEIPPAEPTN